MHYKYQKGRDLVHLHTIQDDLHYIIHILSTERKKFQEDVSLLFRSLKRRITEEKQEGDGRIQTEKSPIGFSYTGG